MTGRDFLKLIFDLFPASTAEETRTDARGHVMSHGFCDLQTFSGADGLMVGGGAGLGAFSQQYRTFSHQGRHPRNASGKTERGESHTSNRMPRNITHNPLDKHMHLVP